MTRAAPARSEHADAAITAERQELKFLVAKEGLAALKAAIRAELAPHRFTGEAANRLPDAQHFVTTIYFDTASRSYYQAAQSNRESHVKVRAKEYYDLHASLAELATDPEQILRYQPWLWFELKRREGAVTSKRRFRFPKLAAATLFDEQAPPELRLDVPSERADAEALIAHVRAQQEPIAPSAVVNYQRLSFQNPDSTLRVTIDTGLSYFAVPAGLFRRTRPLSRGELGRPAATQSRAVVEVKLRSEMPPWLEAALSRCSEGQVSFSKFISASGAVHGE